MWLLICIAVLLPFPFYYFLWTNPQIWVDFCGKGSDPCHRMAQVSHFLKIIQFLALSSVAHFSWPPWYCCLLFTLGQFLNFRWAFFIWVLLGFTFFACFWLISIWVLLGFLVSALSPIGCCCWVFLFFACLWLILIWVLLGFLVFASFWFISILLLLGFLLVFGSFCEFILLGFFYCIGFCIIWLFFLFWVLLFD